MALLEDMDAQQCNNRFWIILVCEWPMTCE
jgi:hypothetical protein